MMRTTLAAVALLSFLILACGKDEEEAVAGAIKSSIPVAIWLSLCVFLLFNLPCLIIITFDNVLMFVNPILH